MKQPSWPLFSPPAPRFPNQPCRCKLRGFDCFPRTHQAGPEPRVSFPISVASGQDQDISRPAPQANNIATLLQITIDRFPIGLEPVLGLSTKQALRIPTATHRDRTLGFKKIREIIPRPFGCHLIARSGDGHVLAK